MDEKRTELVPLGYLTVGTKFQNVKPRTDSWF